MAELFTPAMLRRLVQQPHLIGHLVGKTKLTELHSKWIRDLWIPKRNTGIQAHRGGYKSTGPTEVGIAWWLLLHPNDRIALIRETHTAACDSLKTIAQYMQHELLQELFFALHRRYPTTLVERANKLVYDFKGTVTKEGSVDAYGIDNVPTGSHYDVILADDVITIKDRYSRAKRERTRTNLQEVVTNILDPGKYLRHVGTPWHPEDAWNLDCLPPPEKYTVHETGILSPAQIEEKRRTTTPVMFAINYELQHITDADAMFREPVFGEWHHRKIHNVQAHVDARFSGTHFTALTIIGVRHDGKYQVFMRCFDQHVKDCVDEILREMYLRSADVLHIENNPDKGWAADLFRRGGSKKWRTPVVYDYHESMNKQRKIEAYISDFWSRLVLSEDCDSEALSQLLSYNGGEPDDAPDSLASLIRQGYHDTDAVTSTTNILNQE